MGTENGYEMGTKWVRNGIRDLYRSSGLKFKGLHDFHHLFNT